MNCIANIFVLLIDHNNYKKYAVNTNENLNVDRMLIMFKCYFKILKFDFKLKKKKLFLEDKCN